MVENRVLDQMCEVNRAEFGSDKAGGWESRLAVIGRVDRESKVPRTRTEDA